MNQTNAPIKRTLIQLCLLSCLLSLILVLFSPPTGKLIRALILSRMERQGISVPQPDSLSYAFPLSASIKRATIKLANSPIELSDISFTPSFGFSGLGFSLNASAFGGKVEASSVRGSDTFTVGALRISDIDLGRIPALSSIGITKGTLLLTSNGGNYENLPFEASFSNLTFSPSSLLDTTLKIQEIVLESLVFNGATQKEKISGTLNGKGVAGTIKGEFSASQLNLDGKAELVLSDLGARTVGPLLGLFGASNAGAGEPLNLTIRGSLSSPRLSVVRKAGS